MDLYELQQHSLQKQSTVETPRPPLGPAEKNNGTTTRRSRTREVSSRYKSPTPVASSGPRRFPSPTVTRTTTSNVSNPKRAISAERRRPSTPPSPPSPSPSTPVQDTSTEMLGGSKKVVASSRMPESLWPSTMRSLNVSFQSDSFSLPISKREKAVTHVLTDRTLRPSSNVARKQSEITSASRKSTPERKRSPLKGKNSSDQSENFRPVEGVHSRLVEQHRWPSRTGGKISSSSTNKSIDLGDKVSRIPSLPHSGSGIPSLRRWSLDGMTKPLQKSASDLLAQVTADQGGKQSSVDDNSLELNKSASSASLDTTRLLNPAVRSQSLPVHGSRPASPNRASASLSSVSRAASPLRTKTSTTVPSRGPSPSRSRTSSPLRQSSNPTSVLSYIVDIKKGKKTANHIEDVHQLRLLYNRQLQWRFANARAEVALQSQEEQAELTLNGVWRIISDLRQSIMEKRTQLQQLMLKLKLFRVLNYQLAYLDEWSLIDGDHADSLSQIIRDLQTSTLRLPVTGGARVDIQSVKAAVSSAVDVMQAMGSSICHVLTEVCSSISSAP
ncbi:OLC1v1035470C5 [Oldenlandia corymbosa var. corymbosa]|uniref:OLC1v1035470C5 n=1 Tax=Oldenlandia corymbosa var. corymbosa TaxID=529605 RepID=A0AAV1CT15_OLDCO|nr:OLC1v1035470C5 [Oldenlandia corymbosa var. corymbosa]